MENTEAELENAFLSGGLVGYYDHFNSAGESASEISSTPSSVSSETAVESAEDPGPPSAGQPHRPLRHRPLVQLQRLDEQGVIGACRRGRKRGRKNRTQSQRMAEVDDKRVQKNARERERVSNVNAEYKRLREALGDVDDSRKKKYHKLRTLTAAINYIQAMMAELDTLKREGGEADEPGPSPSDGSYPVAVEPEVRVAQTLPFLISSISCPTCARVNGLPFVSCFFNVLVRICSLQIFMYSHNPCLCLCHLVSSHGVLPRHICRVNYTWLEATTCNTAPVTQRARSAAAATALPSGPPAHLPSTSAARRAWS